MVIVSLSSLPVRHTCPQSPAQIVRDALNYEMGMWVGGCPWHYEIDSGGVPMTFENRSKMVSKVILYDMETTLQMLMNLSRALSVECTVHIYFPQKIDTHPLDLL